MRPGTVLRERVVGACGLRGGRASCRPAGGPEAPYLTGCAGRAVPGAELHVPLRATAAEAGLVAETLAAGTLAGVTVEVR
jgi:hypothetical protein